MAVPAWAGQDYPFGPHISGTDLRQGVNATFSRYSTAIYGSANANKLQGKSVDSATPATDDVLHYNGTSWTHDSIATILGFSPAPLASPTLTGTPAAPTAAANTNTTQLATTAFVGLADKIGTASITASSGSIANSDTLLVKTAVLSTTGARFVAGSAIRINVVGIFTYSTAAAAPVFVVRLGTNGTTADAAILTFTLATSAASGSSVPFAMTFYVTWTSGTACNGTMALVNQGTTGISTTATQIIDTSGSSLTQAENQMLSISGKTGGSSTMTIKHASIELVNG
jgi:hypothetical protein